MAFQADCSADQPLTHALSSQLWYLNKALKMADPTLVCPLAFCFYNTSSIALGEQADFATATKLSLTLT